MSENTDEEHLDNSANPRSENIPDGIIPAKETGTDNPNQETENMEIHKHPHHVTHKKKLGEYLLEFLMLFLAVFLGFIAENIREHYVEDERTKEYAQSLYDDLKVDTATIQRTHNEKEWILAKFDSAAIMLQSNDVSKNNEFIYYVERYLTFNDIFSPQDVTYQQLRSSGNFRYIKNIALYKNIAAYYNLYSRYQAVDGNFGIINKNELSEMEAKLFNVKDLTGLDNYKGADFYNLALRPDRKLAPILNDKLNLNLLSIQIANAKWRTNGSKLFLRWLKASSSDLINQLKQEYKLE